jgi:hypothetical protein
MTVMNKTYPHVGRYDVIVAGAGPAGTAAAIAAGRHGLKTLLLEGTGCAGGTSTAGALPFWLGTMNGSIPFPQMIKKGLQYRDCPRPRRVVGGIFEDACNRIRLQQGGIGPCKLAQTDKYPGLDRLGCHDEFTFDIEAGKRVLDEMLLEADVEILYYTTAVDVEMVGNQIDGVWFVNKSGMQYASTSIVIDATGDADLVDRAGFDTYKGDKITGEMTAASLVAHLENIDAGAIEKYLNAGNDPWFRPLCQQAIKDHPDLDLPSHLIVFPMVQDGVFMINGGTSFSDYDGTSGRDMTGLTLRGRRRARLLAEVLFKDYIPGGENCRLRRVAEYPGVRETRRIIADKELREQDLLDGKRFEDTIALAGRHFDLSRKQGQVFAEAGKYVKNGITEIPYGTLIPQRSNNILAAGRCIAAEGQALGPVRIMSTCFAIGEAAGTAAALKLKSNTAFRDIDVQKLRRMLRSQGAIVE